MEYSIALPALEVAVMVIVPSATPQSVGSEEATLVMVGVTGSTRFTIAPVTSQDSSAFLTIILYGLLLPSSPVNEPPFCTQFRPPSMLYSNGAVPPLAVIVIVPFETPQSVGSVDATLVIVGAAGTDNITGLAASALVQLPSIFLTKTL